MYNTFIKIYNAQQVRSSIKKTNLRSIWNLWFSHYESELHSISQWKQWQLLWTTILHRRWLNYLKL